MKKKCYKFPPLLLFSSSLRRTYMHLYEYLRFWAERNELELRFETYRRKETQFTFLKIKI